MARRVMEGLAHGERSRSWLHAALALLGLAALAALTLLVAGRAYSAAPAPLLPVADAHVRSDQADAKLGGLAILRVDPTPITRAYLRFDVQGLSGPPAKALLRLHAETTHADGYRVARVASLSWLESTITYNNAPPIDAATVGGSGPFSAGDWTTVDVTSLVSGNGLVSFGLVAAKETNVNSMNLSSRESGANAPQLLITSGPTPDTTTPSVPANVQAQALSTSAIKVSWSASTDNVAVAGYRVYRDDGPTFDLGAGATSYTDSGLAPATSHGYQVDAVDTATNRSARSAVASATTLASGASPPLLPVADAYVRSDQAGSNFGSSTTLRVDADPIARAYLRFDVGGLDGPISKAVLRTFAMTGSSTGYRVSGVASTTWGETTIKYDNAPAVDVASAGASGGFAAGAWTEVDVTALVRGSGPVSMALTTTSTSSFTLASRESGAKAPQLVLTTAQPDTTPPSAPTGLAVRASSATAMALAWNAATDNVAVAGYAIYRDGTQGGLTHGATVTAFTDSSLSADTLYTYAVEAFDAAGNRSARSAAVGATTERPDTDPAIRATFYYPWFPEAWDQLGIKPYTKYTPSLGFYDSADRAVIDEHIRAMQYGRFEAGIASWWGQGTKTDGRISSLLAAAAGTSFRWALYYEPESVGDPSVSKIRADLTYIRDRYAISPSYLRVDGQFVVFVYSTNGSCAMVDRWESANTVGAYIVLKIFPGSTSCARQPEGWHQYSPSKPSVSRDGQFINISPGFDKAGESAPRLGRDLVRWRQNVRDLAASNAPFKLVTSFDEWGEGTSVESARQWESASGYGAYLDVLREEIPAP